MLKMFVFCSLHVYIMSFNACAVYVYYYTCSGFILHMCHVNICLSCMSVLCVYMYTHIVCICVYDVH